MIYSLEGKLLERGDNFFVVQCGGVAFKINTNKTTLTGIFLRKAAVCRVFTHLYLREEKIELYGFLNKKALDVFQLLISVTLVGPRTALNVLDVGTLEEVSAAIAGGEVGLLSKVPGIGKKTAERIVLELKNKLTKKDGVIYKMKIDDEVEAALLELGFPRDRIREVIRKLDDKTERLEDRLKSALRLMHK